MLPSLLFLVSSKEAPVETRCGCPRPSPHPPACRAPNSRRSMGILLGFMLGRRGWTRETWSGSSKTTPVWAVTAPYLEVGPRTTSGDAGVSVLKRVIVDSMLGLVEPLPDPRQNQHHHDIHHD